MIFPSYSISFQCSGIYLIFFLFLYFNNLASSCCRSDFDVSAALTYESCWVSFPNVYTRSTNTRGYAEKTSPPPAVWEEVISLQTVLITQSLSRRVFFSALANTPPCSAKTICHYFFETLFVALHADATLFHLVFSPLITCFSSYRNHRRLL